MLVLVAGFAWLANWQYHRAGEKQALIDAIHRGAHAAPIDLNRALRDNRSVSRYRRVRVSGHYDAAHQILVREIVHHSRRGYYVLTPFKLRGANAWVMVNRGWIAKRGDTHSLSASGAARTVTGLWTRLPRPGLRLGSKAPVPHGWPKKLLYPTRAQLADVLGRHVVAGSIWLAADQPDGFVRDWNPMPRFGPGRHIGYMATWIALGLTVLITWIVLNLHGEKRDNRP